VGRYLGLIASSRDQDVRRMTSQRRARANGNLYVSYISEVPIWKTTYRIVLLPKRKETLLQGWAIVDNTVGEIGQRGTLAGGRSAALFYSTTLGALL